MEFLFTRITDETNSYYLQIYEIMIHIVAILIIVGGIIFGLIDASKQITGIAQAIFPHFWAFFIWAIIGFIGSMLFLFLGKIKLLTLVNIEDTKNEMVKMNSLLSEKVSPKTSK